MTKNIPVRFKTVSLITAALCSMSVAHAVDADKDPHHEAESMPVTHEPAEAAGAEAKPLAIQAGGVLLQFGGFVKLDLMQDFDPIGNPDQFKVNSIPVSTDPSSQQGGSSNITARATRFTMDVRSTEGPANGLRAYVEGDFYGSGNSFRLRHGYGEWKGILAGQTWTTFQDISARPYTVDYEGADAEVFVRQALIRYTKKQSDGFQWSVAAENAESQITAAAGADGSGRSQIPDFAGTLRFSNATGHIQIGGLLRQLRWVSSDGSVDETTGGYGLNLSGKTKVFGNNAIMGHIAFGSGMGRYVESFGGTNSDAVYTDGGDLTALDTWAATFGYAHAWNDRMISTLSGSIAELDNNSEQPGSAIKSTRSVHANLLYKPFPQLAFGGELMWGKRENNNGDSGDAIRLQFTVQYKFR